jgi:hypothetical protein
MNVSRIRSALPLTLYACSPRSSSTQKSSPIERSFCFIWKRMGSSFSLPFGSGITRNG